MIAFAVAVQLRPWPKLMVETRWVDADRDAVEEDAPTGGAVPVRDTEVYTPDDGAEGDEWVARTLGFAPWRKAGALNG